MIDEATADFTLKTNTKSFRIHKLIFGVRSCVFQAMVQTNMAEAQVGEAIIEDLDDKTLEEMIHFIHTGRLSGRQFGKVSLLYAAMKYKLDSLQGLIVLKLGLPNVEGHQVPREDEGAPDGVQQNEGEGCRASVSY